MKKQFTAFLALLALTTSLAGCGQKNEVAETTEVVVSEENTVGTEEMPSAAESEENTDITEETNVDEASDTNSEDQTDNNKQDAKDEESSKEDSKGEATQEAPSKPAAQEKPTEQIKPNESQKPSVPAKPSKPAELQKPTEQTKPTESQKPTQPTPPAHTEKPVDTQKPTERPEVSTLSSSDIFSQITSGMDFSNHLDLDNDFLKDYYGIDPSLLEDYCVKIPMMSMHITEIGVFKVKDANNISSVVAGINGRANDLGISLYPSLEATYEARVIEVKGNYILFAIADNASDIQNRFNSLVK